MFRILSERMRLPSHSSNEGSDGGAQVEHPSPEEDITVIWDPKYWIRHFFLKEFLNFFIELFNTASCCRPSDPTVSEDDGIEPRPFLRLWYWQSDAPTTWQDLIHQFCISSTTRLGLIYDSASSHPQVGLGQISSTTQLEFIHNSARSHPQLT